jgi:hypothetical protein
MDVRLNLTRSLLDGFARESRLTWAKANQKQAAVEVDAVRDQVENQVWSAYSQPGKRSASRRRQPRSSAASESYDAALESYNYGILSQIDVVSAQRALAVVRRRRECVHPAVDRNCRNGVPAWRPAPRKRAVTVTRELSSPSLPRIIGVVVAAATLLLAGCSRAPSFNILGSFFPSWILCGAIGILLTVAARLLFVRIKLEEQLSPLIVVYPCLAAFLTFSLWLLFFR